MKFKEITQKTEAELRKELTTLQSKVADLRVKMQLGQVKNTREVAKIRKDIARILTFLSSR